MIDMIQKYETDFRSAVDGQKLYLYFPNARKNRGPCLQGEGMTVIRLTAPCLAKSCLILVPDIIVHQVSCQKTEKLVQNKKRKESDYDDFVDSSSAASLRYDVLAGYG